MPVTEAFSLGRTVITPAALTLLNRVRLHPWYLLNKHSNCDWDDQGEESKAQNLAALDGSDRIITVYKHQTHEGMFSDVDRTDSFWVITEHDRSVTTILLPSEY